MLKGPVVGSLRIIWKAAARKLPRIQVIPEALAAYTFPGTRIVTAVARLEVFLFFTFHHVLLIGVDLSYGWY